MLRSVVCPVGRSFRHNAMNRSISSFLCLSFSAAPLACDALPADPERAGEAIQTDSLAHNLVDEGAYLMTSIAFEYENRTAWKYQAKRSGWSADSVSSGSAAFPPTLPPVGPALQPAVTTPRRAFRVSTCGDGRPRRFPCSRPGETCPAPNP